MLISALWVWREVHEFSVNRKDRIVEAQGMNSHLMRRKFIQYVLWASGLCLMTAGLWAQPFAQSTVQIEGVIKNGTTGKPVQGQRMILLEPSQGMEAVSTVVSDAAGRFKFEKATGPFFVVQTHYQGANYDQPVQPQDRGLTETNVTVYDSTSSDAQVAVTRAQWRLAPDGGKLGIEEVFEVTNSSNPPKTLVRPEGSFQFELPAGATVDSASVEETAGMPLPQTPREIVAGKLYAIDRPIQPGTTRIGVRFTADYASQSFDFSQTLAHAIGEIDIFLPKDMRFSGADGLTPGSGTVQGYQVLVAQDKRANEAVALHVAGGTTPADDSGNGNGGDSGGQSEVTQLPNAIGAIQVPLVSLLGLVVIWALGFAVFQRPEKTKTADGLSPEKRKQIVEQKDYLVRRILELDARIEAKEISERDYHLQRSRLKSKCAVLMRRLQPAPARKREKTVA